MLLSLTDILRYFSIFAHSTIENKTSFSVWHLQDSSCQGLSRYCNVWQVSQMKSLSAVSPYFLAKPRIPLNYMNTKPLWICHLLSFYLELQAVFTFTKLHVGYWQCSATFFFSPPFSLPPNTERVFNVIRNVFSKGRRPFISPNAESHFSSIVCTIQFSLSCPISHPWAFVHGEQKNDKW